MMVGDHMTADPASAAATRHRKAGSSRAAAYWRLSADGELR